MFKPHFSWFPQFAFIKNVIFMDLRKHYVKNRKGSNIIQKQFTKWKKSTYSKVKRKKKDIIFFFFQLSTCLLQIEENLVTEQSCKEVMKIYCI